MTSRAPMTAARKHLYLKVGLVCVALLVGYFVSVHKPELLPDVGVTAFASLLMLEVIFLPLRQREVAREQYILVLSEIRSRQSLGIPDDEVERVLQRWADSLRKDLSPSDILKAEHQSQLQFLTSGAPMTGKGFIFSQNR